MKKILISESQLIEIIKRALSEQYTPPQKQTFGTPSAYQQTGFGPRYTPPFDWQVYEKEYEAFNEPSASPFFSKMGKYREIPAQTNKYFWDPTVEGETTQQQMDGQGRVFNKKIQTKGAWVVKSVKNVDSWRDVPAGYLPADYDKAVAWNEAQKKYPRQFGQESTQVNVNLPNIKNPYYNKNYPLGTTPDIAAIRDLEAERIRQAHKAKFSPPPPGADNTYGMMTKYRQGVQASLDKMRDHQIDRLNASYGFYYDKIVDDESFLDQNWVTVLRFALYVIPFTAPYAKYINMGLDLIKAAQTLEQGDVAKASIESLFAIISITPLKAALQNVNLKNGLVKLASSSGALSEAETMALKQLNPKDVAKAIGSTAQKALSQFGVSQPVSKQIVQYTENASAKYLSDVEKSISILGQKSKLTNSKKEKGA